MNLKLNIKVLLQMRDDLLQLRMIVSHNRNEEVRKKLTDEVDEKLRCVESLRKHYKSVLDKVELLSAK